MLLRKTTSYFQGLQEMPFIYPEIHEILKANLVWSLKWFPNSMLVSIQIHLLPHSTSIITKHITVIHSAEIYGTGIRPCMGFQQEQSRWPHLSVPQSLVWDLLIPSRRSVSLWSTPSHLPRPSSRGISSAEPFLILISSHSL